MLVERIGLGSSSPPPPPGVVLLLVTSASVRGLQNNTCNLLVDSKLHRYLANADEPTNKVSTVRLRVLHILTDQELLLGEFPLSRNS
jgi:hypothetical protein